MKHLHFVGIGGIGMSGLASWCRSLNIKVTGSDRDSGKAENNHILAPLRAQGIEIFPQDGSFINAGKPDFLIYSSAIEADNPDFIAAGNIEAITGVSAADSQLFSASLAVSKTHTVHAQKQYFEKHS